MQPDNVIEIKTLTKRFLKDDPVASEYEGVIARVTDTRDPSWLPALRLALSAAAEYQVRWERTAEALPSDYKRNRPGAWVVDSNAGYGKKYVSSLRSAIEACTPAGEPVAYEPTKKRRRWRSG